MTQYDDLRKVCHRHRSPQKRFHMSYIPEALTGCWLWTGAPTGSYGYGRIMVNGVPMSDRIGVGACECDDCNKHFRFRTQFL
jgi:hypothetical protein